MEITSTGGVDPATKRANLKLLLAMIVFAIGLTALCIVWMHFHAERVNGEQLNGPAFMAPGVPRSQALAWERTCLGELPASSAAAIRRSRSFADKGIPKPELGNEKAADSDFVLRTIHPLDSQAFSC